MKDIGNYRKSYEKSELLETNIPEDPINLFNRWFHEVEDFGGVDEVNAMTVSTREQSTPLACYYALLTPLKLRRTCAAEGWHNCSLR